MPLKHSEWCDVAVFADANFTLCDTINLFLAIVRTAVAVRWAGQNHDVRINPRIRTDEHPLRIDDPNTTVKNYSGPHPSKTSAVV